MVSLHNSNDNIIVLSCTASTTDESTSITGTGLILNNGEGHTFASVYTGLSGGVKSTSPGINVPPGSLKVGATVVAVV